jgi:hypothetical protein
MQAKEINQTKIIETIVLLKEVITNPLAFKDDESLIKALKSQGGLAKYKNEERHIVLCSLNTFKTNSDRLLERGFLSLDELRNNAKFAIEGAHQETKANKRTQTGLKLIIANLEEKLEASQLDNIMLMSLIWELGSKLKKLSEHEGAIEERKELYRVYNNVIRSKIESSKIEQLSDNEVAIEERKES